MKTEEQIEAFQDIYGLHKEILNRYASKGRKWIKIDFNIISKYNPDLGNLLLEQPEEVLKAAEIALEHFQMEDKHVRIFGIPRSQQRTIWSIRGQDVGKFIALRGIINKTSGIQHILESARFECPSCGNIIPVLMLNNQFREPSKCGCKFKGKFRMLEPKPTDKITIGIIDDLMEEDNANRTMAREKLSILSDDLTVHEIDNQLTPGRKVLLNGYLKYVQNKNSCEFESVFIVNSIEFVKVGWDVINIVPEEAARFNQLSQEKDILKRMAESVADISGYQSVKIACLLLLAGAPSIYKNKQLDFRGTIHILLIGDPGSGKTYAARRFGSLSPIYSFQSAATASGRGLVAAVAQDADLKTWAIYPGVVAMANKGVVVIDEIDKTHEDDYGDHNNAMNDMEVPIAKSNVKGKLTTETSYLATANPQDKVFSNYTSFYSQIKMPKDFMDRFDIIFPMLSPIEKDAKDKVMDIMLYRHDENNGSTENKWLPEFTHEEIRKYIAYCRQQKPRPVFNPELREVVKNKLHELMKPSGEEQVKISFRQVDILMRLAYASARLHLRDITLDDINLAYELKKKSFIDLGIINEHGEFSWAKLEDVKTEEISARNKFMNIFNELLPKQNTMIEEGKLEDRCGAEGISYEEMNKFIENLRFKGDIINPKRGWIQRI